jgi:competence protein ComEC
MVARGCWLVPPLASRPSRRVAWLPSRAIVSDNQARSSGASLVASPGRSVRWRRLSHEGRGYYCVLHCGAMASLSVITLFAALAASSAREMPRSLDVYWIDVEGGGATLIVTPAGESLLVDAGNPGGRDAGRIHEVATKVAGLARIDHLVVTHLHRDHFGGVAELAALMPVQALYENGIDSAPETERRQPDVEAYRQAKVGKRVVIQPGTELPLIQSPGTAPLRVRFLAARQSLVPALAPSPNPAICKDLSEGPADLSDNANSVVLLLELGRFRFFDGGDLTWNTEGRLVCPEDRVGPVDVYQSNHHGVDNSNSGVLVRTLQPQVVVFNNGPQKGYGPASAATVKATPSVKAVYQVHRNLREGAQNSDPAHVANDKDSETCAGNHVRMSVDPRGETYSLSVPSTGHQQSYQTRR